jgi:hypothetical protein
MPTILFLNGFRFFFFSQEGSEPPHIHVEHGDKVAKYWLNPVELAIVRGVQESRIDTGSRNDHRTPSFVYGEVA